MQYYPTPEDVSRVIRKHLPNDLGCVLEPSAGEGALLSLLDSCRNEYRSLTLIDIDPTKCELLNLKYPGAKIFCSDFVNWSSGGFKFDTIIANPPFSGKPGCEAKYDGFSGPVELAFVRKSIALLNDGGIFLAILPSSVIASDIGIPIRNEIVKLDLKYCYELPAYSFKGIEGTFFVLILRKSNSGRAVKLRTVDDDGGVEELYVDRETLALNKNRFDFSYYSTFSGSGDYYSVLDHFDLEEHSFNSVFRGAIRSNYKEPGLVHSTYFNNGFWSRYSGADTDYVICCQRVSRSAHLSFGILERSLVEKCTDCVVIIEVGNDYLLSTLFYLRVIFSCERGKKYLLRGTGSKYISLTDLRRIKLFDISVIFKEDFLIYMNFYINSDYLGMLKVEDSMRYKIFFGSKVSMISGAASTSSKKGDYKHSTYG
jgi:hypothetical protein